MKIGFVATTGVGKTTVAGLLFTAIQLYRGGGKQWKERALLPPKETIEEFEKEIMDFEFNLRADANTLKVLGGLDRTLQAGRFPEATPKGELVEITTQLITKGNIINRLFGRDRIDEITIYDIAGGHVKEIEELIAIAKDRRDRFTLIDKIQANKVLSSLLSSDVFVLLLDASNCYYEHSDDFQERANRMEKLRLNDHEVNVVLTVAEEFKERMNQNINALAFLFTKHDEIMTYTPPLKNQKDYEEFIEKYFYATNTQFKALKRLCDINKINYFKSGVRLYEKPIEGRKVPDVPLKFYITEYLRLLHWISTLS